MNYKIVIDAGHGGVDSGSLGNGIIEKDMNLDISNYMLQRFKDLGFYVEATRTSDVALNPKERVRDILSKFGNGTDVITISNHLNAGGGEGAQVIYALRNSDKLASSILKEIAETGQVICKSYQRRLPNDLSSDYNYIIRDTANTQALIMEYGFLDNAKDAEKLKSNWKKYAEAVVKAVANYSGKEYIQKNDGLIDNAIGIHTVVSGDTLWGVANKYNLKVEELKAFNNLSSNMLSIGQVLKLPGLYARGNVNVHIVVSGDTLLSIANKYGVSLQNILDANNMISSNLSIGQEVIIPEKASENVFDTIDLESTKKFDESEDIIHIVISGDTLWNIATVYGVSVNDIKEENNLISEDLTIGQKLLIPRA